MCVFSLPILSPVADEIWNSLRMVGTGLSGEHLKRLPSARKSSRVESLFLSSRMKMFLILGSLLACGRFRSKVGQKRFAVLFPPIHL